jgi:hypothetical protein
MNFHPGVYQGERDVESDVNKLLDEALETLRWCRQHMHDRKASEQLRELETKLGYLGLALTWEMDGEQHKADAALGVARGRSRRQQAIDAQLWEDMFWAH